MGYRSEMQSERLNGRTRERTGQGEDKRQIRHYGEKGHMAGQKPTGGRKKKRTYGVEGHRRLWYCKRKDREHQDAGHVRNDTKKERIQEGAARQDGQERQEARGTESKVEDGKDT